MNDAHDIEQHLAKHFRIAIPALDGGADAADVYTSGLDIVFNLAAGMQQPERKEFVISASDRHAELWRQFHDDEAGFRRRFGITQRTQVPALPARAPRRSGGGYIERTFVRAVIWNGVRSIFRGFR